MDSKDEAEKFQKYEVGFTNYLNAKYFSDKDIFRGKVFNEKATMDGMTIKASSQPATRSYADPASFLKESGRTLESLPEFGPNISNGKHTSKKNA